MPAVPALIQIASMTSVAHPPLRICIFGAGAIGGYLAGHLARAGLCQVSVVARGAQLAAMRANGLSVTTPQGSFRVAVHATDDAASLGPQDIVFITLKAQQLDAALPQIATLLDADTAVVPPTTGIPYWFFHGMGGPFNDRRLEAVDPGGRQWEVLHPRRVIGAVIWIGAHCTAPACVVQDGAQAGCPLGEPDGSSSPRLVRLAELFNASGIHARIRPDIRGDIWVKATNSLCFNPVATLTLARMRDLAAEAGAVALLRAMMTEVDALAARLGLQIPYPPEKRIGVTLSAPDHKMSMLQDLEAGRALEWPVMAASLRAVRDLAGLPTPALDAVTALMNVRLATYQTGSPG